MMKNSLPFFELCILLLVFSVHSSYSQVLVNKPKAETATTVNSPLPAQTGYGSGVKTNYIRSREAIGHFPLQESNFLRFKIVAMTSGEPIIAASLTVYDSGAKKSYQNFSDSNGIIQFPLKWLSSDSAKVTLRVAMDTLTTFPIYKNRLYNYEMTFYVDTEAIKRKNEIMKNEGRRKKKKTGVK